MPINLKIELPKKFTGLIRSQEPSDFEFKNLKILIGLSSNLCLKM